MSALEDSIRAMVADEVERQLAATRNAPDRLLSVEQAADRLGIGRSAAYALIGREDLRSVKVLKRRLVPESAVSEFIESAGQT
ncbi:MAG: helix-turn-helix domain-containing protein [Chloroflexota bacterium]